MRRSHEIQYTAGLLRNKGWLVTYDRTVRPSHYNVDVSFGQALRFQRAINAGISYLLFLSVSSKRARLGDWITRCVSLWMPRSVRHLVHRIYLQPIKICEHHKTTKGSETEMPPTPHAPTEELWLSFSKPVQRYCWMHFWTDNDQPNSRTVLSIVHLGPNGLSLRAKPFIIRFDGHK